jgi:rhodanese-related sulfurtransferase
MGFHAAWFPDGVDGWKAAGLPTQDTLPEEFE